MPTTKVKVTYEEIVCYLTSLGAPAKAIKQCPQQWAALQSLAQAHGGDLNRKADVKAAGASSKQAAKDKAAAGRRNHKLSQREIDRIRLAFDHFDADASGKLDIEEFRKAMIDCGMMPLGFEVHELFAEADEDGSKDVDFDEYCRFVQLYKSKQNPCEKLMECFMDAISPRPAYLVRQGSNSVERRPQCAQWRSQCAHRGDRNSAHRSSARSECEHRAPHAAAQRLETQTPLPPQPNQLDDSGACNSTSLCLFSLGR